MRRRRRGAPPGHDRAPRAERRDPPRRVLHLRGDVAGSGPGGAVVIARAHPHRRRAGAEPCRQIELAACRSRALPVEQHHPLAPVRQGNHDSRRIVSIVVARVADHRERAPRSTAIVAAPHHHVDAARPRVGSGRPRLGEGQHDPRAGGHHRGDAVDRVRAVAAQKDRSLLGDEGILRSERRAAFAGSDGSGGTCVGRTRRHERTERNGHTSRGCTRACRRAGHAAPRTARAISLQRPRCSGWRATSSSVTYEMTRSAIPE